MLRLEEPGLLRECIGRFYCRSPQRRADQQEDMLSCFRGVRAARRDDRPSFGDRNMPRDEALERFDQLRVREVRAMDGQTASTFLAKFQSITAGLEPDERIELVVYAHEGVEFLKAVLSDPHANRICSLKWWYDGKKDMNSIAPLLISSCPELASLQVFLKHHFAFDFVSSMLEHPSNKLKVLEMPEYAKGGSARFFAALGQSQVSALALCYSPKFAQGLHEYLARDLLVRLKVRMGNRQVPSVMMVSLAKCIRLAELEMLSCKFSQPTVFTHLPKSITTLTLDSCTFVGGLDWSFLTDSNVRELVFIWVKGVDGNQLGDALTVHLRAKRLDELRLRDCRFADETLVGVEVGRIKRLDIGGHLNDASIELIALALQSPNSELRELVLDYSDETASIKNYLVPALKHPNCNLAKLSLWTSQAEHREAARRVEDMFRKRLALFVLLQGQQVKRRHGPLKRLPVEMLRLVGMALI
ncbi:hypothetical protein BASA81_004503 [Batrachochytrium salamandrivorans]|nr:hypothetical protein BASA81_004503 [Batrachochytrium salamandrivorans]